MDAVGIEANHCFYLDTVGIETVGIKVNTIGIYTSLCECCWSMVECC